MGRMATMGRMAVMTADSPGAAREAGGAGGGLALADFLPYRLSVLSNLVSGAIAEHYRAEFGLTIPQWRVIAVLGEGRDLTARDISAVTAMDKVAVSRAVAALVKRRLAARRPAPQDGRASLLRLTAAGRRIYERVVPAAQALESRLLDGLAASERRALDKLVAKLTDRAKTLGER
ncbi:MAG: MarR family winged helix-turn-helix transcriptional regulator [Parvularculaceae bacterium]